MGESYGDWLGESTQSIWLRDLDLIQEMDLNLLRVTWRTFFLKKKHKKNGRSEGAGCDFCLTNVFLLGCVFLDPKIEIPENRTNVLFLNVLVKKSQK